MKAMKKKLIVCLALLCCTIFPVAAQELYSDRSNGYSGHAGAHYIGTTKDVNLAEHWAGLERHMGKRFTFLRAIQKLSKEENFLLWSALNEYELSSNEVYQVAITWENKSTTLALLVVITDKGRSCTLYDASLWEDK